MIPLVGPGIELPGLRRGSPLARMTAMSFLLRVMLCCGIWLAGPGLGGLTGAERIYELRTYVVNEGKLPDLLARFRDHTCALFERHGMENIGYWTPLDESDGASNTLIYLMAYPDRDAARASWKAFLADPEWVAARNASEAGGKILARAPESVFLELTDYSPPVKPVAGPDIPERVFELRTYKTPPGKLEALHDRFRNHTVGLFSRHGMSHFGYWTPVDEDKGATDTLIYLLIHSSRDAGQKSFAAFRADPEWLAVRAASEREGSLTVQPGGVRSVFLQATDFSPAR